jgi:hypothetical protein
MTKKDIIIGIDPDIDKSGLAVLAPKERQIALYDLTLPQMVDFFRECKKIYDKEGISYVVVVEASYLIQANWHLQWDDSKNKAAAKGKQVGRNHEIGRQIVEFCKHMKMPYEEKLPLKKCWAGKDGKITIKELNLLLEGTGFHPIVTQTNQEKRDAALLALDRSGLPLRMARKQR